MRLIWTHQPHGASLRFLASLATSTCYFNFLAAVPPSMYIKRILLLFLSFVFATPTGLAQVIPEYDLGGASKPKPDLSFRKEDQYKRVHQSSLRFILRGELDKTEEFLDQYLAKHPSDAETLYMLGILHGQRGNIEKAEAFMKRAIAAGLPDDRLIAGPRPMIEPLVETQLLQSLMKKYSERLVHGPLVGNVSGTSASFWVRTATESEIDVVVREPGSDKTIRSEMVKSQASEDFTAVAVVNGLRPNTAVHLRCADLTESPAAAAPI